MRWRRKWVNKLDALDSEFQQQFESFEEFWEQKLHHYDIESSEIETNMKAEHEEEAQTKEEELTEQITGGKMSAKFINLQFKMEQMAKYQRFKEAAEIKTKLEEEYNRCMERIEKERQNKIEKAMKKINMRQESEMKTLNQKIMMNRNDLLKTKQQDYDNLNKKYKAQKSTLLSKIQLTRAQKIKFLNAFDPSKNINVSNLYTRYFDQLEEEEGEEEEEEEEDQQAFDLHNESDDLRESQDMDH